MLRGLPTETSTPLERASRSGMMAVAELMLRQDEDDQEQGERVFPTPHSLAFWGDAEKLERVLANGADADEADEMGETPLLRAVRRGHIDCVRVLLEHGVNVDGTNSLGLSSLHWVAMNGRHDLAELLLSKNVQMTD